MFTINNYKFLEKIGQGAYSQVYKALNLDNQTIHAVKEI